MPREKLDREEAERRNKECRRRYHESHREELLEKQRQARMADPETYRAKKREQYHATIDRLVEAGLYTLLKPGRKRLYTPEEAVEVAKRQRQESYLRRHERLTAAKALLTQEGVEQ
jgi:hypothetical protein